jgi:hypothetical protein
MQVLSTPTNSSPETSGSFFNLFISYRDCMNSWMLLPSLITVSMISPRRYNGKDYLETIYINNFYI